MWRYVSAMLLVLAAGCPGSTAHDPAVRALRAEQDALRLRVDELEKKIAEVVEDRDYLAMWCPLRAGTDDEYADAQCGSQYDCHSTYSLHEDRRCALSTFVYCFQLAGLKTVGQRVIEDPERGDPRCFGTLRACQADRDRVAVRVLAECARTSLVFGPRLPR